MNRRWMGAVLVVVALIAAGVAATLTTDPWASPVAVAHATPPTVAPAGSDAGSPVPHTGSGGSGSLPTPVGVPQPAGAENSAPYDPCPADDGAIPGEGPSAAQAVSIPSIPTSQLPASVSGFNARPGDVPAEFQGTILRPTDTGRYPGIRPAVVLFHGISGDQCQMWWLAQWLAGSGYVTLILTSPTPSAHDPSYGVAIDAAAAAVAFLGDPVANPFGFATNSGDIGLAGWSEGSVVVSVFQGLTNSRAVKAVVALDDLRGSLEGDSGAPLTFCAPPLRGPVTPRVPALGFASDSTCDVEPGDAQPTLKLSGWNRWRDAGVPAVELPLQDYSHFDYDDPGPRLVPVAELTLAWFDSWLENSRSGLQTFLSCQLDGVPTVAALSSRFRAAAYLPSLDINSANWAATLADRCKEPAALVGSQPIQ